MNVMNKLEKAYVCSPCKAATAEQVRKNMLAARTYCEIAALAMGVKAIAPHAWLPEMLDDHVPEEREMAIQMGIELLKMCGSLLVCGNRVSDGMKKEIKLAGELDIAVMVFNSTVLEEVLLINKSAVLIPGDIFQMGIGKLSIPCEEVSEWATGEIAMQKAQ